MVSETGGIGIVVKTNFLEQRFDGENLVITKSDTNHMLVQVETMNEYTEAIDIGYYDEAEQVWKPKMYTYIESDGLIEEVEEVEVIEEATE